MRLELENEKLSDQNPTAIRMPTKLKERLKNAAKDNNRSMNAEIVARLESSFALSVEAKIPSLSGDVQIEPSKSQILKAIVALTEAINHVPE